jgi:hypothetical protein
MRTDRTEYCSSGIGVCPTCGAVEPHLRYHTDEGMWCERCYPFVMPPLTLTESRPTPTIHNASSTLSHVPRRPCWGGVGGNGWVKRKWGAER